jgi:hypothetical protein
VCFQRHNIFVSLIIPGHPGNKMGVYMEPLIDELVRAWEEGVCEREMCPWAISISILVIKCPTQMF